MRLIRTSAVIGLNSPVATVRAAERLTLDATRPATGRQDAPARLVDRRLRARSDLNTKMLPP